MNDNDFELLESHLQELQLELVPVALEENKDERYIIQSIIAEHLEDYKMLNEQLDEILNKIKHQ